MAGLDRRDDAFLSEFRQIFEIDNLGVLDPPAQIVPRFQMFPINGKHKPHRRVTDAMGVDLIASFRGPAANFINALRGFHLHAAIAGIVLVGFEQQGSPGTQGPVREGLNRTDGQSVGGMDTVCDEMREILLGRPEHGIDPELEPAIPMHRFQQEGIVAVGSRVANRGEACGKAVFLGFQQRVLLGIPVRVWDDPLDKLHRVVDE